MVYSFIAERMFICECKQYKGLLDELLKNTPKIIKNNVNNVIGV